MKNMRTVREFKDLTLRIYGVRVHFDFTKISKKHADFWSKLNRLGWEKRTNDPTECEDVDKSAILTSKEWNELLSELAGLTK